MAAIFVWTWKHAESAILFTSNFDELLLGRFAHQLKNRCTSSRQVGHLKLYKLLGYLLRSMCGAAAKLDNLFWDIAHLKVAPIWSKRVRLGPNLNQLFNFQVWTSLWWQNWNGRYSAPYRVAFELTLMDKNWFYSNVQNFAQNSILGSRAKSQSNIWLNFDGVAVAMTETSNVIPMGKRQNL